MSEATHGYVWIAECGCIRGCAVDTPDRAREVAKETGAAIRRGYRIERWELDRIRAAQWKCGDTNCAYMRGVA